MNRLEIEFLKNYDLKTHNLFFQIAGNLMFF